MHRAKLSLTLGLLCAALCVCGPIPERTPSLFETHVLSSPSSDPASLRPAGALSQSLMDTALNSLEPLDRYVLYSGLMALRRSAGAFEDLDSELSVALEEEADPLLGALLALWFGDNALFQGQASAALIRYDAALDRARYGSFMGRSLRAEILAQRSIALNQLGRWEDGVGALSRAAAFADRPQALRFLRRAADMAEAGGNSRRARALRAQAERAVVPRAEPGSLAKAEVGPSYGSKRPALPSLEDLELLAPWEDGVGQRAGGVSPGLGAYLGYGIRAFARGSKRDPCGKGLTGYYYGIGSHGPTWAQGRDYYAVDFTRGRTSGSRVGNASFGIQLRSPGNGIVIDAHYGTRTHWDARESGPAPQANRVDILHLVEGEEALQVATKGLSFETRPRPPYGIISQSLHLAGLEDPCGEGGCLEYPALVSFGQFVVRGTPLGYEDATGLSVIDHLHFALTTPCNAREARCLEADPPLRDVSIPIHLEGETLEVDGVGQCIISTNRFLLAKEGLYALQPWLSEPPLPASPSDTSQP